MRDPRLGTRLGILRALGGLSQVAVAPFCVGELRDKAGRARVEVARWWLNCKCRLKIHSMSYNILVAFFWQGWGVRIGRRLLTWPGLSVLGRS